MLIRREFRTTVQSVSIANPIHATAHIHAAPLMCVLVLIDVLIGNTQHIQAQTSRSRAACARGNTGNEEAVWVIVVRLGCCIRDLSTVHHVSQSRRNALQLLGTVLLSKRFNEFSRRVIGGLKLFIGHTLFETFVVGKLTDRDRLKGLLVEREGFPQGWGLPYG